MQEHGQWTSWTLRIGDKVYKSIKPMSLELVCAGSTWCIVFTYNRGPLTFTKTDTIAFLTEGDARGWFNYVYERLFLDDPKAMPPVPPKKSRVNCHLSIVKDRI